MSEGQGSKASKELNSKFAWERAFIRSKTTGNTGFVGLVLSTFDNGDGKGFFMSANKASQLTGLSERTCRRAITDLRHAGWLVATRRGGNQGGVARASTYRLQIPTAAQSTEGIPQPEDPRPQPEADDPVVDPVTSIDPLQPQAHSVDVSNLEDGDEVPTGTVAELTQAQQAHFSPSFDADEMWVYSSTALSAVVESQESPVDTRSELARRNSHAWSLREEGLDPMGEPLPKRTRR